MTLEHCLILGAVLFCIGLLGALTRRNAVVVLFSIEIMLNAANLAFVAVARGLGTMEGQVIVFFVMTLAAAEAAVGLAVILAMFRNRQTVDAGEISLLKW